MNRRKFIQKETLNWIRPEDEKPKDGAFIMLCYMHDPEDENTLEGTFYTAESKDFSEQWGQYMTPDYWAYVKGPKE